MYSHSWLQLLNSKEEKIYVNDFNKDTSFLWRNILLTQKLVYLYAPSVSWNTGFHSTEKSVVLPKHLCRMRNMWLLEVSFSTEINPHQHWENVFDIDDLKRLKYYNCKRKSHATMKLSNITNVLTNVGMLHGSFGLLQWSIIIV